MRWTAADGELTDSDDQRHRGRHRAQDQYRATSPSFRPSWSGSRRGSPSAISAAASARQLDDERQELRQQIAAAPRRPRGGQERQLATTPILFRYGSGASRAGTGAEPTVGEAAENAADTFLGALNVLLVIFVSLSPWLLSGLALVAVRLFRRRAAPAGAETGA